jgi:hypothetical protein
MFNASLLGKWCPTFEINILPSSPRVQGSVFMDLEDEDSSHLPSNVTLPAKCTEYSFIDFYGMSEYEFFISICPKHQTA